MAKAKTNQELIKDIMEFSQYGALSQVMVMTAVEQFADHVIANEDSLIKEYDEAIAQNRNPILNIRSWIGVAKEIKRKFNNRNL